MNTALMPILASLLLVAGCSGRSLDLETPSVSDALPQPANLSWWSRAAMDAVMRVSAWRGAHPGYVVLFARDGVPVYSNAAGWKDIASRQPMQVGTRMRIASMTKPVTAAAAMMLVEEGRLSLDDPVARYLPAFAGIRVATSHVPNPDGSFTTRPATVPLTIRHLLTFTSGIGPGMDMESDLVQLWDERGIYKQTTGTLQDRVNALARLPFAEEPGTRWRYGFSADVLAAVMEVITGQEIAVILRERIFEPLGMEHTEYVSEVNAPQELATVYTFDHRRELVQGTPHVYVGWNPGEGGLVSSAPDYMRFALMLWNGGEYRGVRILQRETVDSMRHLHVPDGVLADVGIDGLGWGLGMAVVADADASLTPDRTGDFWWSGYFGTTFFVSPSTDLVGIVFTQRQPNEFTGDPIEVFVLQGLAFAGL